MDRDTGMAAGLDTGSKSASPQAVKASCDFSKLMGHREMEFRTDNEPAIVALQEKVRD